MVAIALSLVMLLTLTACGNTDVSEGQKESFNLAAVPSEQGEVQQDEAGQEMPQQEIDMDTKTLVVYFSCTGTTKPLAEYAAEILGADLYEIVPEEPYTEADLAYYTNGRADREQEDRIHALQYPAAWTIWINMKL